MNIITLDNGLQFIVDDVVVVSATPTETVINVNDFTYIIKVN